MSKRVGLDAVPDDADIVNWLNARYTEDHEELLVYMNEFNEVIEMCKQDNEPIEFAYARLLNNLATLDSPKVLRMLAAFLWKMAK